MSVFRAELERLINRHSMESGSDTPDFVLANFLVDSLEAFDRAVRHRDRLAGRDPAPVGLHFPPEAPTPRCLGATPLSFAETT